MKKNFKSNESQSCEISLYSNEFAKHYTDDAAIALDKLENHCKEYNHPYNENMLDLAKMIVRHLYADMVLCKIYQDIQCQPKFWEECAKAQPQNNVDPHCPWDVD